MQKDKKVNQTTTHLRCINEQLEFNFDQEPAKDTSSHRVKVNLTITGRSKPLEIDDFIEFKGSSNE